MDLDWLEIAFKTEQRLKYRKFLRFRLTHFNVYYLAMIVISIVLALLNLFLK
jgi:hypothetical protein